MRLTSSAWYVDVVTEKKCRYLCNQGYADFMVAGGTEAALDPLAVSGFAKMRALSRSSDPRTASRPFDENRDGFVIGHLITLNWCPSSLTVLACFR